MWKDAPHCKLFSSVQSLSRVQLFAIPWTAAPQTFLSITNSQSSLKLTSIESVIQISHLILCHPSHQVVKVLELQLQHQSFQWTFRIYFLYDWLVWSPCSPRDSQDSSPAQFKNINSLALRLIYGPTLTSVHDYGQIDSFDYMELCRQSNASAFGFPSKEKSSFNFIAAVTICSNFWAQEKFCHCLHFPHLFAMKWWDWMPWS